MKLFTIKKVLLIIALFLVVFGCSSDEKTLKISPSSLKFGDINIGDNVTQDLILTNKYGKFILITSTPS